LALGSADSKPTIFRPKPYNASACDWQIAGPRIGSNKPALPYPSPDCQVFPVIFFPRAVALRDGHVIRAHIPGDRSVVLDIRDLKRQVRNSMPKRCFQIFANGLASVKSLVVRRKVNCIVRVSRHQAVQFPCIPMPRTFIADSADCGCDVHCSSPHRRTIPRSKSPFGSFSLSCLHGQPPFETVIARSISRRCIFSVFFEVGEALPPAVETSSQMRQDAGLD
jgi:hypothetical protein